MKMTFDSHAHYDDKSFDVDRDELISSFPEAGVGYVCNVAYDIKSCGTTMALAEKYDGFYAAVGVHPSDCKDMKEEDLSVLEEYSQKEKVVAIGEIGLDYYWEKDASARENQKKWFKKQLELSRKTRLPFIIHSRDAAKDTYDILKEHCKEPGPEGVVHCFSYSSEMARMFLDLGLYIGIGGVVTFKNSREIKEVAAMVPIDRLLLETDSPYLSPLRGKRNDSRNLTMVAEAIGQIRGEDASYIIESTRENALRFYGINNT